MMRALVTGGSAGIGLAICQAFLDADYDVVSLDRQPSPLRHAKLHAIVVDLSDKAVTERAARDAVSEPVTTVVHNAGMIRPALLAQASTADLAALSRLHLGAALVLVQAALPAMRAARFGRIVLISSRAVLGLATRTAYAATKAGLLRLARTWAMELGPDGITVNAVAPGPIAGTAMFHDVLPHGASTHWHRAFRCAASASRRMWRAPCCSWQIQLAVSSPDRRCSYAVGPASGVCDCEPNNLSRAARGRGLSRITPAARRPAAAAVPCR